MQHSTGCFKNNIIIGECMTYEVPKFDLGRISEIFKNYYGLSGEFTSLVSFEDQNVMIKSERGKFVLKIANKAWSKNFISMQTDVLIHLRKQAPHLTLPSVIKSLNGDNMIEVDGFTMRLLSFLEGDVIAKTTRTPELYSDIGRFLGDFSKAMEGYDHPGRDGSDPNWKLDNVIACKKYLPEVVDEDTRDRIARLYDYYEENIVPVLSGLRKAVLHGDANEQNFLILPDQPDKIAGLIDFGEMQYGAQVNELAIMLAYCLLNEDDIEMASKRMIEGYVANFPLQPEEMEILYHLAAMRLVTNITMTSHQSKQQPDNEYILIAQGPAKILLKRLEEEKYIMN